MPTAELAYLFRHGLMRDVAYQLQPPSARTRLHEFAVYLLEASYGGHAPEPYALDDPNAPEFEPHSTDTVAAELAMHAQLALAGLEQKSAELEECQKLYLRRAAEHAESQFQIEASIEAWQALALLLHGAAGGEALRRAAVVLGKSGRFSHAEELLLDARTAQQEIGSRSGEAAVLGSLATVYQFTGRMELAEQTYGQALAIQREVGNRRMEGVVLGNLAAVYHFTGRMELAEQTCELALAISDRGGQDNILGSLAGIYQNTGRMEQAESTYKQVLANNREVGDRRLEGVMLGNLAAVYSNTGRIEQAEQTYELALFIGREVGDQSFQGWILCVKACMFVAVARISQAREGWMQGVSILRELSNTAVLKRLTAVMCEACTKAGIEPFDIPEIEEDSAGASA